MAPEQKASLAERMAQRRKDQMAEATKDKPQELGRWKPDPPLSSPFVQEK